MTRSLIRLLTPWWMLSWSRSQVLCCYLYLYFMESADSCQSCFETDPINLPQYILLSLSAFCISWIPLFHISSEVPNAVPCWWELLVFLILCLWMPSIPNRSLGMGILSATRSVSFLLLITIWYPQSETPEACTIVAYTLWYLEYLLLVTSRTHTVLQDIPIPILFIGTRR